MIRYLLCTICCAVALHAQTPTPARELTTKYCLSCHNSKVKTAGLALDAWRHPETEIHVFEADVFGDRDGAD